jgi:SAM-dependent methyltransferase
MRSFSESHPQIRWLEADIETVDLNPQLFDLVLSVRTFHYIEHYAEVASRMYDWIVPGGTIVFSVEHPLKYANSQGEWIVDEEGNATAWPVDAYLQPGPRVEEGNGVRLVKWHRPLSMYVNELIRVGFKIRAVVEPDFTDLGWREQLAAAESNRRRPNLLVIRADRD